MNLRFIEEPQLVFGNGQHICPRAGISKYGVFDQGSNARRKEILIGVVGIDEDISLFRDWMDQCSRAIEADPDVKQKHLSPLFVGFNEDIGFKSRLVLPDEYQKRLNKKELKELLKIANINDRIESVVDFYHAAIAFLGLNKKPDVIVCLIPPFFEGTIIQRFEREIEETTDDQQSTNESDFRRALKAKCMYLAIPIQLLREHTITHSKGFQDPAVRAWNFCTALYYKANGTPWKLVTAAHAPQTCFVGIGFYRSRDKKTIQTSMAQVFDELGNGVILRGANIEKDKQDRQPHLTSEQAYNLLYMALSEYKVAMDNLPGRLVLHKTSKYSVDELEGFNNVIREFGITSHDLITILDTELRIFRSGLYPPLRGTELQLDSDRCLLYTRGSVEYYETYPGMYIPSPLDIRVQDGSHSIHSIAEEILALTKMNWNNTQFDGKYPITISCARKVGQIMKYIPESEKPQIRYSYYM